MGIFLLTLALMGGTGLVAAVALYLIAKRFSVCEDPRTVLVEQCLPGANCGACGFKGCHDFAANCVSATNLSGLNCPGAGETGMRKIGSILGLDADNGPKRVLTLNCAGSCDKRIHYRTYDGPQSCAVQATLGTGTTDCIWGCLGCGDCVEACAFGALSLDAESGLPEIDRNKCVACGVCTNHCPRHLLELRNISQTQETIVYVACNNRDKGARAMKVCNVSCIGCGKCIKVCPGKIPVVSDSLANINADQCTGCGTCVEACPRKSIKSVSI